MAHDVFIGYATPDKKVADAVCSLLENKGIRCWIAPRDVPIGKFGGVIVEAVTQSKVMVFIFSAHSNPSTNCLTEVHTAFNKGIKIIVLRLDNTNPSEDMEYYLQLYHWLDAQEPPIEKHLEMLTNRVEKELADIDAKARADAQKKAQAEEQVRAQKAAEEAEKERQEAEAAVKEKKRLGAEAKARQQAEEARKAKESALKAREEAEAKKIPVEKRPTKTKAVWLWSGAGVVISIVVVVLVFTMFGPKTTVPEPPTTTTATVTETQSATTTTTTLPAPEAASISGKVASDADGKGIPNVTVALMETNSGRCITTTNTNSDGTYTFSHLAAGTYKIKTTPSTNHLLYADEHYNNTFDYFSAEIITLHVGQKIEGIDLSLGPASTISGTVRNADGSTPLVHISVECFILKDGVLLGGSCTATITDALGNYTIYGLPYGEYIIRAPSLTRFATGEGDYAPEYYNETPRQSLAQHVKVDAGINPIGIDFTLAIGGSISGKVISDVTKEGIAGVNVIAFDFSTNEWISQTITGADGTYTVHGLPTGSYRVSIMPEKFGLPYFDLNSFSSVYVNTGLDTPNINFSLTPTS